MSSPCNSLVFYGALMVCLTAPCLSQEPAPPGRLLDSARPPSSRPDYQTKTLRGRMVWMAEALQRRFGVKSVDEASQRIIALETFAGELYPVVENVRGRAFRQDKRLREMDVEIQVRQFRGSPMIQVMRLYQFDRKTGQKHELDYWCDICSIAMYELKPCDCCQEEIRLRRRPVEEK